MGLALLVVAMLGQHPAGSADDTYVRHTVSGLSFELPAAWRITQRGETTRFEAPGGSAYLLVDTDRVDAPGLDANACRARLRKRLFRGTWSEAKVGSYAILRSSGIERSPNLENQARIDRIVGCDGAEAWSLMFVSELRNWAYTSRVSARAMDSVLPAREAPPNRTDS